MAFSDARNKLPSGIGIETPTIGAGPRSSTATAVTAFGQIAGQAYEGAVTADMRNKLQVVGNEIATVNSPATGAYVGPNTGEFYGLDLTKSDPTGTVDQTTDRFKRLELARTQGLITHQRAQLEADVILREAITKAPGFSANLRQSAANELGFNPSGAALEQLYLSGPDASKTVKQTQVDKDWEQADAYVTAHVFGDRETAFGFIQQGRADKITQDNNALAIQRGAMSTPHMVNSAVSDFSTTANGLILGMSAQIGKGGVQNPDQWVAGLVQEAEKLKDTYRSNMDASPVKYPQGSYDSVMKAIDDKVTTYSKMAQDNDFLQVVKDKRDSMIAVAQMAGINAAPDLYMVNFVAGRPGVEAYLNIMQLAHGNPKALKELAETNPKYGFMTQFAGKLPELSNAISLAYQGKLGEAVKAATMDKGLAEATTRAIGQNAVDTGDANAAGTAMSNGAQLNLPQVSISVAAQNPNSFNIADEKTRAYIVRSTRGNMESAIQTATATLQGTKFMAGYDPVESKFVAVPRAGFEVTPENSILNNPMLMQPQSDFGGFNMPPLGYGGADQASPGPAIQGPEVTRALEVLNNQVLPLMDQPGWATAINESGTADKDEFINNTVNRINLGALDQELHTQGYGSQAIQRQKVQDQIAFQKALESGDQAGVDSYLKKFGVETAKDLTKPSAVDTGSPMIKKLEDGTYLNQDDGTHFIIEDGQVRPFFGGTVQRSGETSSFPDAGYGSLTLPSSLNGAQAQNVAYLTDAATTFGVDPNVLISLSFSESSLNANAENNDKPENTSAGLAGLIATTAKEVGVTDVKDPKQSAMGGARYLKRALNVTKGDYREALALYHGGISKDQPDAADYKYADDILSRLGQQSTDTQSYDLNVERY